MGSKDRGERRAGARVAGMAVGLSVLAILFFGLGDMTTVRGSATTTTTGQVTKGDAGFVEERRTAASLEKSVKPVDSKTDRGEEAPLPPRLATSEEAIFTRFKAPNVKMGPFSYFKRIEPRQNFTYCGQTYAEEPFVLVTTEPDHRCKCYATHCNDIDYPTHSYVMLGVGGSKEDQDSLRVNLEKVSEASEFPLRVLFWFGGGKADACPNSPADASNNNDEKVYSTHNEKTGPSVETVVHGSGLRYPAYNTILQGMVNNKADRDAYQRNSFLVLTEQGRNLEELRDGLVRFSNGLKVSVSGQSDGYKELSKLVPRHLAIGEQTAQKCKKFNQYDNSFIIQYFKRPRNIAQIV